MIQPVIKWSGSKRSQAKIIKQYIPEIIDTYFEPFVGGGSILYTVNPTKAVCGDICEPLIALWNEIKYNPKRLSKAYQQRWEALQLHGFEIYYNIRENFNQTHSPEDFLFLSRTCVNGLIRFNSKGEFNNSLHYTRPGISPEKLEKIIFDWSEKIKNTIFLSQDYEKTTKSAKKGDLVYLDPPYFHTKGRYYGTIDFDNFLSYLNELNQKEVKIMLSFDGIRGTDDFTISFPKKLFKRHILIPSGKSSFKKVMDKTSLDVSESLYLNW